MPLFNNYAGFNVWVATFGITLEARDSNGNLHKEELEDSKKAAKVKTKEQGVSLERHFVKCALASLVYSSRTWSSPSRDTADSSGKA